MSGDFVIGGQQSLLQWPSSSNPSLIASAGSPKCGAKCQKCDKQGSVGLDKESGLPYLTMTLYVLPRCGHSVCVGCKTQVHSNIVNAKLMPGRLRAVGSIKKRCFLVKFLAWFLCAYF